MGRQQLHGQAAGTYYYYYCRSHTTLLTTHTPLLLLLQAKERVLLHAYYGPHNQELYALIGRDMGWEQMASPDAGQS